MAKINKFWIDYFGLAIFLRRNKKRWIPWNPPHNNNRITSLISVNYDRFSPYSVIGNYSYEVNARSNIAVEDKFGTVGYI